MRFDIIFIARADHGADVLMTSQPLAALTAPEADYLPERGLFARLCKILHSLA